MVRRMRAVASGALLSVALLLAAACGEGGTGEEAAPTPTSVVLQKGSETFTSWTVSASRPGALDFRELTDANLQAIQEAVERYEELRMEWECSLSLEGLPMREVATERAIAAIEQYLAKKREENICEVIDATVVAYYTELSANAAFVYLEGTGTSRYFDRATGEEVRTPDSFQASPAGARLVKGEDGRWRVDQFGPVRQQQ